MSQPREYVAIHAAPASLRPWALCVILRRVDAGPVLAARIHANTFACLNVVAHALGHILDPRNPPDVLASGGGGPPTFDAMLGRLTAGHYTLLHIVAHGAVRCGGVLQPARFLAGPLSAPRETATEGPLASASLVLQPWVLEPWFGLRPDRIADALVQADALHAGPVCEALLAVASDDAGLPALWSTLGRLASEAPVTVPGLALPVLWARGVVAAAAAVGCSERQYRRRFLRALGLGPAAWLRVRRWEATVQGLLAPDAAPLAVLAADHGYADQAHLARETQSFVRTTPSRLRAAADWPLAPARVRILQDDGDGTA